jgi:hypothetical protein
MVPNDWLEIGIVNGWVGPPVCLTHDGAPTTASEDEEFDEGGEPCVFMLRLFDDDEQTRLAVEKNHSPSIWRRTNMRIGKS